MNYEREGEIYRSLKELLSAKSAKFQSVINSKEFQLHGDNKTDEISTYEEDYELEDGQGERTAREEKKEEKEEEKKKKEVRS